MSHRAIQHKHLLGNHIPVLSRFSDVEEVVSQICSKEFLSSGNKEKFTRVNKELLRVIQEHPTPCFLLAAVLEFITKINERGFLDEPLTLMMFEFWLNQFSGLASEEILHVRGKIIGKFVPRDEYQVFFPVGGGKYFPGSHFVAAHLSPDVDSTVASFWGWADAFGCRVAEGVHQWSLPSGLSDGYIQSFFSSLFGKDVLLQLPRQLPTATISALDLLTRREFRRVSMSASVNTIEHTEQEHAVVVVDDDGFYAGEWRSQDAEAVRQIVAAFSHCLRWFERQCQGRLIRVLARERVTISDVRQSYEKILETCIKESAEVGEVPVKVKRLVDDYLRCVLELADGMNSTYRELLIQLDRRFESRFENFLAECQALLAASFYDGAGLMMADRAHATCALERVVHALEVALETVRGATDQLSHLMKIKEIVLKTPHAFVTLKSDVDEMRSKIDHFDHLTVVVQERADKFFPIGVVHADDLHQPVLGTATFRDFSNPEETKMASYIEAISIVDHHKMHIQTTTAPTLLIGDVQSSNTLVAEQALKVNSQYGGKECSKDFGYFVDTRRELSEYFSYIYGILDDTDLLTKASRRDVICMKDLLDRIHMLINGKKSSVSFEGIPNDLTFAKKAAKVLVGTQDLHSIYESVYTFREGEVERALLAASRHETSTLFADTKEQNGCCRVGQTKLFLSNLQTFQKNKEQILQLWQKSAEAIFTARPHIDFFLHMLSTVPAETEVFSGKEISWTHKDEIWMWVPEGGVPEQHLIGFLNRFRVSPALKSFSMDVELRGSLTESRSRLFAQNFSKAKTIVKHGGAGPSLAILTFPAGALTSRKSQVSPFLPKVIP